MLNQVLAVACREVIDHWRDRRALFSATVYSLMGPAVVGMVSLAIGGTEKSGAVLAAMMSVFALVSAFTGGMNVAMDAIAGERERRSLLPLLMHPVSRKDILLGKWMAVAIFSLASLLLNFLSFALVPGRMPPWYTAVCLLPVALLAAALELWVSTVCRGVKEAQSYLSMLVFLPMGLGMFMVFSPASGHGWWRFVPVAGHQLQMEAGLRGAAPDPLELICLIISTAVFAGLALLAAADRLEQDNVVYGG